MTALFALIRPFLPYLIAIGIGFSAGWGGAWHIQGLRVTAKDQEITKIHQDAEETKIAAEQQNQRIDAEHQANLKEVTAHYENLIPAVRDGAVAAYRLRHPIVHSSASPLPKTGPSQQVDDGAGKECVAATGEPDPQFIADAAVDAAKVEAWRSWCALNQCPVE